MRGKGRNTERCLYFHELVEARKLLLGREQVAIIFKVTVQSGMIRKQQTSVNHYLCLSSAKLKESERGRLRKQERKGRYRRN